MVTKNEVNIQNRQINYNYDIVEKYECGIELKGTEVKSIRESMCNLKESFALLRGNEVIVKNIHISHYKMGNINNVDTTRDRRLLLHKYEIIKIKNSIKQNGYTLIPSRIYTKKGLVKLELALCKGKKLYDKRESLKKKEANKQMNIFKSY